MDKRKLRFYSKRNIAVIQSIYYILSGIWPIAHLSSFMAVTGPKEDVWLVKTVGGLAAAIGVSLFSGTRSKVMSYETCILAFGSALTFLLVDVIYYFNGTLSWAYALDAVPELSWTLYWFIALMSFRSSSKPASIN